MSIIISDGRGNNGGGEIRALSVCRRRRRHRQFTSAGLKAINSLVESCVCRYRITEF